MAHQFNTCFSNRTTRRNDSMKKFRRRYFMVFNGFPNTAAKSGNLQCLFSWLKPSRESITPRPLFVFYSFQTGSLPGVAGNFNCSSNTSSKSTPSFKSNISA